MFRERQIVTTLTKPRNSWPLIPIGQDSGYNDEGGVLVNTSADGVDLNVIWSDIQAALRAWNAERGALTNLLSRNIGVLFVLALRVHENQRRGLQYYRAYMFFSVSLIEFYLKNSAPIRVPPKRSH